MASLHGWWVRGEGPASAVAAQQQHVDAALDMLSPTFDPLKALRAEGVRLPDPQARPLDNLHRCRQLLPPEHPDALAPLQRGPASKEAELARERAKSRAGYVQQQRDRQQQRVNPLEEMVARVAEGPLTLLKRAYAARARVRVVTRHATGVRGVATGTLVAFDRYCNLVLWEVDETYTVLLKVQRAGRQCRAQEQRQRHLKQVFVKGQGVVMVSVASGQAAAASAGDGSGAASRQAGPGRRQRPPEG